MKTLTILVVDDDPVIRKLLHTRLSKKGYDVEVAEDGQVAENLLAEKRYDVVLTDLVMPGISGIEVLEIVKEKDEQIEVIVITAHSSIDTAVDAMKKGAFDYLEKPINFEELFVRIEKIVAIKSIMRNALDLHDAMNIKETEASNTIQNLEMTAGVLQTRLDSIEEILRNISMEPETRIANALDVLAGFSS